MTEALSDEIKQAVETSKVNRERNAIKKIEMEATSNRIEKRTCETHGEFDSTVTKIKMMKRSYETSCPTCKAEQVAAEHVETKNKNETLVKASLDNDICVARIPKRYKSKSFDSFEADSPKKQIALRKLVNYGVNFGLMLETGQCMILTGNVGTGKTHLANAVANQLVQDGFRPVFVTLFGMIAEVKATWGDKTKSEAAVIANFVKCDLLIIDEIGVQFSSNVENIFLFDIVNSRYEAMRPTMIISNFPVASEKDVSIEKIIGTRVLDRLREGGGSQVTFDWESYRGKI